jgi:hypothetical protein
MSLQPFASTKAAITDKEQYDDGHNKDRNEGNNIATNNIDDNASVPVVEPIVAAINISLPANINNNNGMTPVSNSTNNIIVPPSPTPSTPLVGPLTSSPSSLTSLPTLAGSSISSVASTVGPAAVVGVGVVVGGASLNLRRRPILSASDQFPVGTVVHIKSSEAVLAKAQLRAYANTRAVITACPIHPNTWYQVQLHTGHTIKLRSSSFTVGPPSPPPPPAPSTRVTTTNALTSTTYDSSSTSFGNSNSGVATTTSRAPLPLHVSEQLTPQAAYHQFNNALNLMSGTHFHDASNSATAAAAAATAAAAYMAQQSQLAMAFSALTPPHSPLPSMLHSLPFGMPPFTGGGGALDANQLMMALMLHHQQQQQHQQHQQQQQQHQHQQLSPLPLSGMGFPFPFAHHQHPTTTAAALMALQQANTRDPSTIAAQLGLHITPPSSPSPGSSGTSLFHNLAAMTPPFTNPSATLPSLSSIPPLSPLSPAHQLMTPAASPSTTASSISISHSPSASASVSSQSVSLRPFVAALQARAAASSNNNSSLSVSVSSLPSSPTIPPLTVERGPSKDSLPNSSATSRVISASATTTAASNSSNGNIPSPVPSFPRSSSGYNSSGNNSGVALRSSPIARTSMGSTTPTSGSNGMGLFEMMRVAATMQSNDAKNESSSATPSSLPPSTVATIRCSSPSSATVTSVASTSAAAGGSSGSGGVVGGIQVVIPIARKRKDFPSPYTHTLQLNGMPSSVSSPVTSVASSSSSLSSTTSSSASNTTLAGAAVNSKVEASVGTASSHGEVHVDKVARTDAPTR